LSNRTASENPGRSFHLRIRRRSGCL
jgi:hypothetical protein